MRLLEYIKAHKFGLIIFGITFAVAVFIGELGVRLIGFINPNQEITHDTIYVQPPSQDTLLQDISTQVREINSKIPTKKPARRRCAKKNDTIKVDAVIHLDKRVE